MPFKCDICCSTFSQKINLKAHVSSVHEGKMPFKCDICGSGFSVIRLLKAHEKKKPFKCDACSASFKSNQDLKRQMVSFYEEKKPFKCDVCDAKFSYKGKSSVYERKKRS